MAKDVRKETFDRKWMRNYLAFKSFVSSKGRLPRYNEREDGLLIGAWFQNQRRAYKIKEYNKDRFELLYDVIPVWYKDIKSIKLHFKRLSCSKVEREFYVLMVEGYLSEDELVKLSNRGIDTLAKYYDVLAREIRVSKGLFFFPKNFRVVFKRLFSETSLEKVQLLYLGYSDGFSASNLFKLSNIKLLLSGDNLKLALSNSYSESIFVGFELSERYYNIAYGLLSGESSRSIAESIKVTDVRVIQIFNSVKKKIRKNRLLDIPNWAKDESSLCFALARMYDYNYCILKIKMFKEDETMSLVENVERRKYVKGYRKSLFFLSEEEKMDIYENPMNEKGEFRGVVLGLVNYCDEVLTGESVPTRVYVCLKRCGCLSVRDLLIADNMYFKDVRGVGEEVLREINEVRVDLARRILKNYFDGLFVRNKEDCYMLDSIIEKYPSVKIEDARRVFRRYDLKDQISRNYALVLYQHGIETLYDILLTNEDDLKGLLVLKDYECSIPKEIKGRLYEIIERELSWEILK